MTWFPGPSRGLLLHSGGSVPPFAPCSEPEGFLEIMLIVSANFWKGKRWQNTSQSRARGASDGACINFPLVRNCVSVSLKQKCQANVLKRGDAAKGGAAGREAVINVQRLLA